MSNSAIQYLFSDEAQTKCTGNINVITELMRCFGKSTDKTIKAWIKNKNPLLTTPAAVAIIKRLTGLSENKIVVTKTLKAA